MPLRRLFRDPLKPAQTAQLTWRSRFAAQLLCERFSKGRIPERGVMVNLDTKRSGPIAVDPRNWERFVLRQQPENATAEAV